MNAMKEGLYTSAELRELVNIRHKKTFSENYLNPAISLGLIGMTHPNSPNSPTQKYFLISKQSLTTKKKITPIAKEK